jgi:hypothetical protein
VAVLTCIVRGPEHHVDKAVIISDGRDNAAGPDGIQRAGEAF